MQSHRLDGMSAGARPHRGVRHHRPGSASTHRYSFTVADVVESPEASGLLDELTRLAGREDPYPRYRRLREISPVVRAQDGALVVTRHADCAAVTRNPRL